MVNLQRSSVVRLVRTAIVAGSVVWIAPSVAVAEDDPAPSAPSREEWRAAMDKLPAPKEGCFTSSYPRVEWRQTVCVTAPHLPYPPALGSGSDVVGNGNDASGYVKNVMTTAIGSFPKVTGVTSEKGDVGGSPPLVANTYTLQLNTQFFTTKVCNGQSGCQGWQQFVYSSSEGQAFMQYWLIGYIGSKNASCPSGWFTYQTDCYTNSSGVTVNNGSRIPIGQLVDLSLKAAAVLNGNDTLTLNDGKTAYAVSGKDSKVDLASSWHAAEFNIVGDCCATQAVFNEGASLEVHIVTDHGNADAPSCLGSGFTGETNNLYFVATSTHKIPGSPPAIYFTEAGKKTSASACASATSVGD